MERSENQDYYGYYEPEDDRDFELQGRLIIVCDGMGGHAGGEVASRLAVNTIIEHYREDRQDDRAQALRRAVEAANRAVWDHATQKPELKGMGSTCVSMVLRSGMAYFGHVGDSRCYLIRNDQLLQITKDHSLVQQMVDEGLLQESEMESHPEKNVILRSLGVKPDVEVEINQMPYQVDDIFILSTDGLTGLVSKEECRRIGLLTKDNPMEGARLLVDLANKYGGYDNITVQIARILALSPDAAPKNGGAKPDSNTALFTQEDVQRSIAEARKKAAEAAKSAPSAAEMAGNVQKKGQAKQQVTGMMDRSEVERIKQEVAAQKAAAAQPPRPPASAPAAEKGGSSKALAVVIVVALVAVLGTFALNSKMSGNMSELLERLAAAEAKAEPLKGTPAWEKAHDLAAAARKKAKGMFGAFTASHDLEAAINAYEKLTPASGKTTGSTGMTGEDADRAKKLMQEAQQLAAEAGAAQHAPVDWERADKAAAEAAKAAGEGRFDDAAAAYAMAENGFRRAAQTARDRQAEKELAERRAAAMKEKEAAARYAKDYFPELLDEASTALTESEMIQKTSASRALEKVAYAQRLLQGANRFALDFEKKN
jgi:protein phosphatase